MNRNDLYACGIFDRKPTVERMMCGFPARLAIIQAALGETPETRQAAAQLSKANRLQCLNRCRHGQQFFNLFQVAAALNERMLDLEAEVRYLGDCDNCSHRNHDAGRCKMCDCGCASAFSKSNGNQNFSQPLA